MSCSFISSAQDGNQRADEIDKSSSDTNRQGQEQVGNGATSPTATTLGGKVVDAAAACVAVWLQILEFFNKVFLEAFEDRTFVRGAVRSRQGADAVLFGDHDSIERSFDSVGDGVCW